MKRPPVVTRPILAGFTELGEPERTIRADGYLRGSLGLVGIGNSLIAPSVVIRPILFPASSVNHARRRSAVIPDGCPASG